MSNLVVNNLYFVVSFSILSLMYAGLLRGVRAVIYGLLVMVLCFFIWDSVALQSITGVQSHVMTLCGVLLLGYSVVYYDYLLHITPASKLSKNPFFWVNCAVCYYYGLNLFIFIFSNYIFENLNENEIIVVWTFHTFNNIIKNTLLAIGIYQACKTSIKDVQPEHF